MANKELCTTNNEKALKDFISAIITSDWNDFREKNVPNERYDQELEWLASDHGKKLCELSGVSQKELRTFFEACKEDK